MSMDGLIPTYSVNGNGSGGGWGDAIGAFAGALFGSWWGNGFGGNGNGFGRSGGCCDSGGGSPTVVVTGQGGGHCSTAELDALSGIQSSINGLGLSVVQGQNAANMAACQGFSGVINAANQGFAGLNTAIATGDAGIQQSLCQGFNGVNTAILTSAKDAALGNCQITSAIADCCCNTQKTIMSEGSATRQLIDRYAYEELQSKLCDAKAEIGSLKSQAFTSQAVAGLGAQLRSEINANTANIINHMAAFRTSTSSSSNSNA